MVGLRVLVTGGSGFIGSHLVKRLISDGHEVVVLVRDVLPSPWVNWLNEALKGTVQIRGDILDFNLLRRAVSDYECQMLFHLAAQAVVRKAQADPLTTVHTNVVGALNVLEAARQLDVPFTYIMSTDKIYFEGQNKSEEDALKAGEIYGTSKAMADLLAQSYIQTYGLKIAIGRACFFPQTKVETKNGYKEINKISEGEYVWTHKGRLRKVIQVYKRIYSGDYYRINLGGHRRDGRTNIIGFTCTPEHPVLTDSGWVEARNLREGMKVAVVASSCKICGKLVPVWRKYCSKSCFSKAFNNDEEYSVRRHKWLESNRKAARNPERILKILKKILPKRGMNVHEYYLDLLIQKIAPNTFEFVGDGKLFIGTLCPDWISKDRKLIIEYYGKPRFDRRKRPTIEEKKEYYEKLGYKVLILRDFYNPDKLEKQIRDFVNGNHKFVFVPIKKITKSSTANWKGRKCTAVYNLEVEEDNSYIVSDCVVHNCNCYGYDLSPRIIPNTIRSCLKGENPIIYKGEHTLRQYIFASDMASAIIHLAENNLTGIYNMATNDLLTQEQAVQKILENFTGLKPKYVEREKPIKEIQKQSMNWEKLKNTGWAPKYNFESGIKETIAKFKRYGF